MEEPPSAACRLGCSTWLTCAFSSADTVVALVWGFSENSRRTPEQVPLPRQALSRESGRSARWSSS